MRGPVLSVERLHPAVQHHVVNQLGWSALRPLQAAAVDPLLRGEDALLVAPTAGGKTEAAAFPLLSAMAAEGWRGLSVLYVCPLRALLNNLEPRLAAYGGWLGRTVGLWHGDTGPAARQRMLREPPDLLLTTPESLESMLVSVRVDHRLLFGDLRAVVVDEVHAFAGDDRGWHLLAVLERLGRLAGRPLQRVGLSATVGNPAELLHWLQGSGAGVRPARVVAPDAGTGAAPGSDADVTLDHVGSVRNAATVVAGLHRGEKRLVFCESRREAEELTVALRGRGVETYVSHSSLSRDERRRSETAFAEARDCVIVATSTLELGIDVGDLDRVVQLGAPRTVASFLQRLGRTGRRPGTRRSMLFLATDSDTAVRAAGLLHLWGQGWVEPVVPPPAPRHLVAQQLLALCLQEGRVGDAVWPSWWEGLHGMYDGTEQEIATWLVATGHLEADQGMLFVGPEAERRFGRRHFMALVSVFTAEPEFDVLLGRTELGRVDPSVLTRRADGPRLVVLAGRTWRVTHVDWQRRRCWVEPADDTARMVWQGQPQPLSFRLCRARRAVLLGEDPPVRLTQRATAALAAAREEAAATVSERGTVVRSDEAVWWTWAGGRANATLAAALPDLVDRRLRYDNDRLVLRGEDAVGRLAAAVEALGGQGGTAGQGDTALPVADVDPAAVRGLKFGDALPPQLAVRTLAERATDADGARAVLGEPRVVRTVL